MSTIQTGGITINDYEGYGVGVFVTKNDGKGPAAGQFRPPRRAQDEHVDRSEKIRS